METPDFGIPPRARAPDEHGGAARVPADQAVPAPHAGDGGRGGGRPADRLLGPVGSTVRRPGVGRVDRLATQPRCRGSAVTPFGRHLAFGADPKTQMRISWQVPLAVRKPYVRVGLRPDDLSRKIEAEVRDLHTPGVEGVRVGARAVLPARGPGRPAPGHDVLLRRRPRRLRPGGTRAPLDDRRTFRTAPASPREVRLHRLRRPGRQQRRGRQRPCAAAPEPRLPSARRRHLLRRRQRPGREVGRLRPALLGPVPQAERAGRQVACRGW